MAISKLGICLIIIVVSINLFQTLIIHSCFFFSISFLDSIIFISNITILVNKIKTEFRTNKKLFYVGFYLSNFIFFYII